MDLNTSDRARALEPASTKPRDSSDTAGQKAPAAAHAHEAPRVVVRSEESGVQLNLGDLWAYRELLYFLAWRDIKVRYKQTLLGAAWVVFQPLLMMAVFTVVFNKFARLDTREMPYPLFAYTGLLLWTFFSTSVVSGTNSLISNTSLITKVYFPRAFIPGAAVLAGLVDMLVGSLMLVGLAYYYGVRPTWGVLLLPALVTVAAVMALSVGMLSAALTVKYRDLRHVLPFVVQVWMFASPVIYPADIVPEGWRWVLAVNPMAGVLEGFRAALTGRALDWPHVALSAATAFALLALSYYVFRRLEDTFADVI